MTPKPTQQEIASSSRVYAPQRGIRQDGQLRLSYFAAILNLACSFDLIGQQNPQVPQIVSGRAGDDGVSQYRKERVGIEVL
jgi:hypothetical protein